MKNISIFLSGKEPADIYQEPAKYCAEMLAKNGFDLVWGGTGVGLMKTVSDIFNKNNRKTIGVITERLKAKAKTDATEMFIIEDLFARKKMLIDKGNAFLIMVGGIGTLDEAGEILELKKSGIVDKPVIFLNTEGFFDGIKTQLEIMEREGLLPKTLKK